MWLSVLIFIAETQSKAYQAVYFLDKVNKEDASSLVCVTQFFGSCNDMSNVSVTVRVYAVFQKFGEAAACKAERSAQPRWLDHPSRPPNDRTQLSRCFGLHFNSLTYARFAFLHVV